MLLVHWHEPINVEVFPTVVSIKNGIMEVSYGELNPVSKKLESYNSYYVILYHNIQNFEDKSGMEKVLFFENDINIISRKEMINSYGFINLSRMKSEASFVTILQIDTGVISDEVSEIIICSYISKDLISFDVDLEINFEDMHNIDNMVNALSELPRYKLMDSYSLKINDKEYKSMYDGTTDISNNIITTDSEYFDISIQKYDGINFLEKRNNSYDNETLYLETNAGVLNTRIVQMENGIGSFRLYPFGYKGNVNINIKYDSGNINGSYNFIIR